MGISVIFSDIYVNCVLFTKMDSFFSWGKKDLNIAKMLGKSGNFVRPKKWKSW